MKSISLEGESRSRIISNPVPKAFDNYAVVRTKSVPLCTEYRSYENGTRCECAGHEAAGEVAEALPGTRVKPGDRVVIMPSYPCGECELCTTGDYIHCESIPCNTCNTEKRHRHSCRVCT